MRSSQSGLCCFLAIACGVALRLGPGQTLQYPIILAAPFERNQKRTVYNQTHSHGHALERWPKKLWNKPYTVIMHA
uniref:Putative secreted protein n=1 Tax=Anopheles triannulatus TaxID=58253 RepID=A0A2M4B2Q4_9DIPT